MKTKGCLGIGLGFVVIMAVLAMWVTGKYNGLVPLNENCETQWSNVENVYQKRSDLIPNLVAVAQEYAEFEKSTLTAVIEARSKATQTTIDASALTPENIAKFQEAQSGLGSAMSRLLATFERYPDLKANQNFLALQKELPSIENEIVFERQKFNETVKVYNTRIKTIPTNIIANFAGFLVKGYFKAEAGADKSPKVKELFKK